MTLWGWPETRAVIAGALFGVPCGLGLDRLLDIVGAAIGLR